MIRLPTLFLGLALVAGGAPSALAHAALESASPPVGGEVSAPPEIRLTFSEGVEPKFSSVKVSGPGGQVPLGALSVAAGDAKILVVKLGKPLAPGNYTVKWRAVSVDTHRTQGDFSFTVK